jgi:cytochrome c biogenesis protein CcdA
MKRSTFDAILSFLLGISWTFIVIGAWIVFQITSFLGTGTALFFTILFILLGLFAIALLESMHLYRERFEEMKKQTALLEEIRASLKKE